MKLYGQECIWKPIKLLLAFNETYIVPWKISLSCIPFNNVNWCWSTSCDAYPRINTRSYMYLRRWASARRVISLHELKQCWNNVNFCRTTSQRHTYERTSKRGYMKAPLPCLRWYTIKDFLFVRVDPIPDSTYNLGKKVLGHFNSNIWIMPPLPGTMLKDAMSADSLQNLSTLIGGGGEGHGF